MYKVIYKDNNKTKTLIEEELKVIGLVSAIQFLGGKILNVIEIKDEDLGPILL